MYKYLDSIKSPDDIKKLNIKEKKLLAEEIRYFLIKSVSKTGGHLASNLGVVELTIALLNAFNPPEDKIVWDVGHQTYVYKMLTGRKQDFENLRTLGGMSGFPKTTESKYDAFNTGHASTSISAAFGIAKAMEMSGKSAHSVAVIGDGALTGGMAYEAINAAGVFKKNFIVILNDNEMSISKNVGSLTKHLTRLRSRPIYFKFKAKIERFFLRVPYIGDKLVKIFKRIKDGVRHMLTKSTIFEDLGFAYLGPIDGHDIKNLQHVFESAKKMDTPVLIHIITKKGKGYDLAESMPTKYHGVSASPKGKPSNDKKLENGPKNYSEVFGRKITQLAENNKKICAVTAAMPDGTGLCDFAKRYPDRFFDVAIAEQHAVTFAAGLSINGYKPVFAVYSSFLQRAYDQIFHDVCLQNLDFVFCVDRAGLVGEDGETHQGILDIAYLSHMPNMTLLAPASFDELEMMLTYAIEKHKGPIAIRYPRGDKQLLQTEIYPFELGQTAKIRDGKDALILFAGNMGNIAMKAAEILSQNRKEISVFNLRTLAPINKEHIAKILSEFSVALVLEDGVLRGGVGEAISACANEFALKTRIILKGYKNAVVPHGSVDELYKLCGLDAETIAHEILEKINE